MDRFARNISERLVSYLPDTAQDFLKRYCLFLLTWSGLRRIPVVLLYGPARSSGQPAKLLVAGHDPWVQYLPHRFFAGEPKRNPIGRMSIWALRKMLNGLQPEVDLTIARVERLSGQSVFHDDYLVVPEWVGTRLSVPDDLDKLVRSGGSIRRDMTLVRRHNFQPMVTQGPKDFDMFYHSIYLPFTRSRHGNLTFLRTARDLQDRARRGGILWVRRNDQRVAAVLFERKFLTLDLLALGTVNGDLRLMNDGAIAALYYYVIQLARQVSCTIVDFRGSRPSLSDGLLRYKSKWGVTLYDKPDSFHDLFVRWHNFNGVVKEFLSHTPLIFREHGGFSALNADESLSRAALSVDGLKQIYLVTESGRRPMAKA